MSSQEELTKELKTKSKLCESLKEQLKFSDNEGFVLKNKSKTISAELER